MNQPPPDAATALLDADGRVRISVPCMQCGYNLRTLTAEGRCPECGRAVGESLDLYRSFTGGELNESLRCGMWLLAFGTGVFSLPGLIVVALIILVFDVGGGSDSCGVVTLVLAAIIQLAGFVILTQRMAQLSPQVQTLRRTARWLVAAAVLLGLTSWVLINVNANGPEAGACLAATVATYWLAHAALLQHLRSLPQLQALPGLPVFALVCIGGAAVALGLTTIVAAFMLIRVANIEAISLIILVNVAAQTLLAVFTLAAAIRWHRLAGRTRQALEREGAATERTEASSE